MNASNLKPAQAEPIAKVKIPGWLVSRIRQELVKPDISAWLNQTLLELLSDPTHERLLDAENLYLVLQSRRFPYIKPALPLSDWIQSALAINKNTSPENFLTDSLLYKRFCESIAIVTKHPTRYHSESKRP